MYSTCIFCHTSLGGNESIEHFPVGRRLAFDAAKGRLWVVCRACERWNLSPLEERWEAIEECERLFRGTKLRVSTDHIGLARVKEGTTLVRVGEPQRPEMAAWRYGDQFHRRRGKYITLVAGGAAAAGLFFAGDIAFGLTVGVLGPAIFGGLAGRLMNRTVARVRLTDSVIRLNRFNLADVSLFPNEAQGFALEVPHNSLAIPADDGPVRRLRLFVSAKRPKVVLQGDTALKAARQLLPRINRAGARSSQIAGALGVLESARSADQLFGHTAFSHRGGKISALPASVRLALEMSLHEEDERRALEGELTELEGRWREAEEVAAISDDMFVPAGVTAMLKKLRGS